MRGLIIFTLIFLLISGSGLIARQNACPVKQEENPRRVLDLGDKGLVEGVRTAKRQYTVTRFGTSRQKRWEITLPVNTSDAQTALVASPDGEAVFLMEFSAALKGPGNALIQYIRGGKLIRSLSFEDQQKLMGASLHAVFADEAYLYFLAADEDPDKFRLGKNPKLTFLLNRFRLSDFRFDQVEVMLPQTPDSEWNPQWTFVGQVGAEKYMVLKDADLAANTLHCQVISFDPEGRLVRNFELDYAPEGQAIRPSFHVDENDRSFLLAADYNYLDYSPFGPNPSGSAYRIGAFFGLSLDENSGDFYLSGLSGRESFGKNPFRFKAQAYYGFFLSKFDASGALLWESGHLADGELISERDYLRRYAPVYKLSGIAFDSESEEVSYRIRVGSNEFKFVLGQEGKLLSMGKNGLVVSNRVTEWTPVTSFLQTPTDGPLQSAAVIASSNEDEQKSPIKPALAF
ncbi:hypothetical protein SAMN05192553_102354 [Cyclobacterium xiamenense]|uniref:Uncharacterized protein n=1 Tax=Cyclobacterium xiamenense TaxID=1297121 RepID=A0A1H6W0H0_9BACT|nr:hypothetical protein [Cyclobacterium xiamenense]SEJ09426.1 hypothetical protein SAMN05192553_102354 [Cyclobacterium xiamenense]